MTDERNSDDMRELLGAYALNALDPDERARVDAFLLRDAAARAELHELEHAAAWLGHASLRPPASAWDAISAEVTRDLDAASPAPSPEPEAAPELAPVPDLPADPGPPAPREVTPITSISARPNRGTRWLVAAAVAVLALGAAAGVVALAERTTGKSESTAEQARAALRETAATKTVLRSDDGQWSARAVVLPDRTGYLRPEAMPPTAAGHDLQLWSITPDGPVSAGLVRGPGTWHRFRAAPHATAIAVTQEPRGGSSVPTTNPIVFGDLGSA